MAHGKCITRTPDGNPVLGVLMGRILLELDRRSYQSTKQLRYRLDRSHSAVDSALRRLRAQGLVSRRRPKGLRARGRFAVRWIYYLSYANPVRVEEAIRATKEYLARDPTTPAS